VLRHWEHFWKAFGFIFQSESSRATYFCPSFTTNWTHTNVHHPVPIPFCFFFRILSSGYCCLQFFKWFQWTPEQYMSELGVSREGPRPRRDLNPNRQEISSNNEVTINHLGDCSPTRTCSKFEFSHVSSQETQKCPAAKYLFFSAYLCLPEDLVKIMVRHALFFVPGPGS